VGLGADWRGDRRKRLAWGLVASVSVVALGAYSPAFAQEWRQEQRKPSHGSPHRNDSSPAQLAQAAGEQRFDVPPGDLQVALVAFSRQVDLQLL
jgi:hypothetical protein